MGHISREGKILGSIFLHKFPPSPAAVIGPLTVHPSTEGGAGKKLMNAVLTHAHEQNYGQIRLVQSPSHIYSFVLYTKCIGFSMEMELRQAKNHDVAIMIEREDQITAYAAGIGILNHAVAKSNEDLKILLANTPTSNGPGFFVPARNHEIMRRLLENGFRIGWPANLMTIGSYKESHIPFLPSLAY